MKYTKAMPELISSCITKPRPFRRHESLIHCINFAIFFTVNDTIQFCEHPARVVGSPHNDSADRRKLVHHQHAVRPDVVLQRVCGGHCRRIRNDEALVFARRGGGWDGQQEACEQYRRRSRATVRAHVCWLHRAPVLVVQQKYSKTRTQREESGVDGRVIW